MQICACFSDCIKEKPPKYLDQTQNPKDQVEHLTLSNFGPSQFIFPFLTLPATRPLHAVSEEVRYQIDPSSHKANGSEADRSAQAPPPLPPPSELLTRWRSRSRRQSPAIEVRKYFFFFLIINISAKQKDVVGKIFKAYSGAKPFRTVAHLLSNSGFLNMLDLKICWTKFFLNASEFAIFSECIWPKIETLYFFLAFYLHVNLCTAHGCLQTMIGLICTDEEVGLKKFKEHSCMSFFFLFFHSMRGWWSHLAVNKSETFKGSCSKENIGRGRGREKVKERERDREK